MLKMTSVAGNAFCGNASGASGGQKVRAPETAANRP